MEAFEIQKKAKEAQAEKSETSELTGEDYENASLSRIESYEKFLEENLKLESFVDSIEQNSPNGEIDIYNPEFWYSYRQFIENIWVTKGFPETNDINHDNSEKIQKKIDYIFSGGASVFRGGEHIMRIKQRSLLHALSKKGVSKEALEMLKDTFALYYRSGGYGPKNMSKSVLEQSYLQRIKAIEKIDQSSELLKIKEICTEYGMLHELYNNARRCYMYMGNPTARVVIEKHNKSFDENMLKECELAISATYSLEDAKADFSTEMLDKLVEIEKRDPNLIKSVIDGGCATEFINQASKEVSKVIKDASGYTSLKSGMITVDDIDYEMVSFCKRLKE